MRFFYDPNRTSEPSTSRSNTGLVSRSSIRFAVHLKKMLRAKARERAAKGLLVRKRILDNPDMFPCSAFFALYLWGFLLMYSLRMMTVLRSWRMRFCKKIVGSSRSLSRYSAIWSRRMFMIVVHADMQLGPSPLPAGA